MGRRVMSFPVKKPKKKKAKKLTKAQAAKKRAQVAVLKKLGFASVKFNPATGEREDGLYQAPEGRCKQTVVKV